VQILLTDILGKIVYRNTFNSISVDQRINVPVQNLAKGIYILKVISEEGTRAEKLVVN